MKIFLIIIIVLVIAFMPVFTVYRGGGIPNIMDERIKCEPQVCWYPQKTSLINYLMLKSRGEVYKR